MVEASTGPDVTPSHSRRLHELTTPKLPLNGFPKEHPFNRDGYRYTLAEADPHAPLRKEYDHSPSMANKPIPGFLCRVALPNSALLSVHDRAHQTTLSDDRLTFCGFKFYSTVRANISVPVPDSRQSATAGVPIGWYFEAEILEMVDGAAARIGWAQAYANLQTPLGFDKFGYSYRSRYGSKFHQAIGKHFDDGGGYGQGDVIGCLIASGLAPANQSVKLPQTYKDRPLVKFKSHFYYETKDKVEQAVKNLNSSQGSWIDFYKNGKLVGTAFTDIFEGDYFPALSAYKNAKIRFNPGPEFKFRPTDVSNVRLCPVSDRISQMAVEQSLADITYFVQHGKQLALDNFTMSP